MKETSLIPVNLLGFQSNGVSMFAMNEKKFNFLIISFIQIEKKEEGVYEMCLSITFWTVAKKG